MTRARSMHEAGHSKLVLWDKPENWMGCGRRWVGSSGWRDTCATMADLYQPMAKATKIL